MSDDRRESEIKQAIKEAVDELRKITTDAYKIFGDALDTIQSIAETPRKEGIETDETAMVREGIAKVADHSRNLLGLTRNA